MSTLPSDDPVRKLLDSSEIFISDVLNISNLSIDSNAPTIQSYNKTIDLSIASLLNPTSYLDSKAFETSFDEDYEIIGKIENLISIGNEFICYLYSYRSLSKALPEINIDITDDLSAEERNELIGKKNDVNKKVFDIMKPTIIKLKDLMTFVTNAISQLYDSILHLYNLQQKSASIPSDLYDSVITLLDIMTKIDNLKDTKPSLQNDFSRYKRALGGQFTGEIMEELTRLQNFLTSPQDPRFSKHYIFLKLRNEIKNISNHEEILFDILSYITQQFDSKLYILPEEKFRLLRVIPYFILIIDGNLSDPKSINVFRTYKSKLIPIQKLCRKYPLLPLYGDMTINTYYVIQRAEHWENTSLSSQWNSTQEDIVGIGYDITTSLWESVKMEYMDYNHRLSLILLRCHLFQKSSDEKNIVLGKHVYDIVREGLCILSSHNSMIKLFLTWKYNHPVSESDIIEQNIEEDIQTSPAFVYAKAIKYNLSKIEINVLIELISIMKSLSNILLEAEDRLAPILRYHMHNTIQKLIQIDMIPLLHRVDKKNKQTMLIELLQIRHLAADWIYGIEPRDDYKIKTSTSGSNTSGSNKANHNKQLPHRIVSTSPTQYRLLRSLIQSLYDEKSSIRRKEGMFFGRSELRSEDILYFQAFYTDSFYYPYLLNLSDTIRNITDISDLWYREFYLEVSKCIQFPIDMSLPWILSEYMIQKQSNENIPIIENLFYILDIYNDAAYQSLYILQQQHLYDEIESETNLVFDQIIFLLSEEIYIYYKNLSASMLLDRSYRYKLEEIKSFVVSNNIYDPTIALSNTNSSASANPNINTNTSSNINPNAKGNFTHHLTIPYKRYSILFQQRTVNLLGRSINLNFLITQHINNKFLRDIDISIRRFEAYDFTGIVELNTIIKILSYSHSLLCNSQHNSTLSNTIDGSNHHNSKQYAMALALDSFENMLHEINESFSPTNYKSRISFQILRSLVLDIFPNFSYNHYTQRFVRSPIILRPIEYNKPPKQSITSQLFGTVCHKAYEQWLRLSRGYIGRIHLEHLSELILYCDLFMVIEEVMKNIYDKLDELNGFVLALHGGIPPITYPKFHFLSIGSFGYFEAKLKPILEYDDLKPEVYQGFREIGNTIAFLKNLSDILDIRNGFEFINIAPFISIAPDTTYSVIPKVINTSIGSILSSLQSVDSHTVESIAYSSNITNLIPQTSEVLVKELTMNLTERKSLFHGMLSKLEDYFYQLSLFDSWGPIPNPSNNLSNRTNSVVTTMSENSIVNQLSILNIQSSQAFHKLWSALIFLYCLPQKQVMNSNEIANGEEIVISDEEEFGHGFLYAGCLIIHLLNQRSTFELFDFNNYILKVYEMELLSSKEKRENMTGVDKGLLSDTEEFINTAVILKKLQDELFGYFEAQSKYKNSSKTSKKVMKFHPSDLDV